MADNKCPECGMPPGQCYRICPTQDPYGGNQAAESEDHDFNARYDDISERYSEWCPKHGSYAGDCGGCEAEHYADEEPTDAEVASARQRNIDAGRHTRLHPIGGDNIPF